jgi:wyosine [tRNA(Phe)-imidazoG37] synthetase (radical SAM superfamily)
MKETMIQPPRLALTSQDGAPFRYPRNFLDHRYVYVVLSSRAGGLSVGVNLSPTRQCNFDCIYCEVDRSAASQIEQPVELKTLAGELEDTLKHVFSGEIRASFPTVPADLLKLRHVALSGDGEPTLCPNFTEVVETVVHLRANGRAPYFKTVLITNASALGRLEVIRGITLLTHRDEVWAKLDGGTQAYVDGLNRPGVPLVKAVENIRNLGQTRPVVIQTMVPSIDGRNPFERELGQYIARLRELKAAGTRISLVQIYSATRPTPHSECGHLPLDTLSAIAKQVRAATGLRTEVF